VSGGGVIEFSVSNCFSMLITIHTLNTSSTLCYSKIYNTSSTFWYSKLTYLKCSKPRGYYKAASVWWWTIIVPPMRLGGHRPWSVNNKWILRVPIAQAGHDTKITTILSRAFAVTVGPPLSKHFCASLVIKVFR